MPWLLTLWVYSCKITKCLSRTAARHTFWEHFISTGQDDNEVKLTIFDFYLVCLISEILYCLKNISVSFCAYKMCLYIHRTCALVCLWIKKYFSALHHRNSYSLSLHTGCKQNHMLHRENSWFLVKVQKFQPWNSPILRYIYIVNNLQDTKNK